MKSLNKSVVQNRVKGVKTSAKDLTEIIRKSVQGKGLSDFLCLKNKNTHVIQSLDQVPTPTSRIWRLQSCDSKFRVKKVRKSDVETSMLKENHCGQACVRSVPAWRPRGVIEWKHGITLETPWYRRCESQEIIAKRLTKGMDTARERERSVLQAAKLEVRRFLSPLKSNMELQNLKFAFWASEFWSCFGLVFWMVMYNWDYCMLEVCNLLSYFTEVYSS